MKRLISSLILAGFLISGVIGCDSKPNPPAAKDDKMPQKAPPKADK